MIGDSLSGDSRLTKLLKAQPNPNNGTVPGGLAYVLQQALLGYAGNKDGQDKSAAMDALTRGMSAKPWVNPDTGEVGKPGSAGGYAGASAALQGLGDNPYARDLASQLMMSQAQSEADNGQWQSRFDAQNQAQNDRLDKQLQAQKDLAQWKAMHPDPTSTPSNIAEWQSYQRMTPEQQQQYLIMKRANPYLNLGDSFAQPDPTNPGQIMGTPINVGVAPQQKIDNTNNRIITAPGVPSGPSAGWAAAHGGQAPMPNQGQPAMPTQAPPVQGQQPPVAPPAPQPAPLAQPQVNSAPVAPSSAPGVQELPAPKSQMVKAQTALDQFANNSKFIGDTVDLAINQASQGGTGMGSILGNLPGTQANDLRNTLNTLKANVGFDRLQQMRDNSPTGGALGNVSDTEGKLLQAVQGALEPNQTKEQLVRNLQHVKQLYGQVATEKQQAFKLTFGSDGPASNNGGWSIQKVQ